MPTTYKIVFIFLFLSFYSLAQFSDKNKHYADSLLSITKSNSDKLKVANAYLQLSELYSLIDLDSVLYFAAKSEKFATEGFQKATKIERQNEYTSVIAGANNNMGYAYTNKGDLSNALKSHKKALDLWKKTNDTPSIAQSLNNIGVVYRKLEEYEKALKFFNTALQTYRKVGDEQPMAMTYNNLGGVYKMLEEDKKAKESYDKSLQLRRQIGDNRGVAATLNNIGALFKKQGELDSALWYFTESLTLIESVGDKMGIAHATNNIGEIAFLKYDIPRAIELGQKALRIGEELGVLPITEQSSYLLQRVYEKSGQWQKAYEMQSLHLNTILQIKSEEAQKEAILLEMQFEFDKQNEIKQINSQKQATITKNEERVHAITTYFITICFFLVTIFLIILNKRFKIMRQQKEIIEKQNNERKTMLQEIHHRVKNNFQIISSLLRLQINQEDNQHLKAAFQEAINRIHTMAIVHEIIYKQDVLDSVEAKVYLTNLISNLQRTFRNSNVVIDVESCNDSLGLEQTIPLGIIVNELITNSFKHAFKENNPNPRISINLNKIDELFVLYYKDNGVGYDASQRKDSFGVMLIETVVEQISGVVEILSDTQWNTSIKISFIKSEV